MGLTGCTSTITLNEDAARHRDVCGSEINGYAVWLLPPRSMVGQSALNRSIGVRIPGGQPILVRAEDFRPNFTSRIGQT